MIFSTKLPHRAEKGVDFTRNHSRGYCGNIRNFSDPEVARWFFEQPLTEISQSTQFIESFITEFEEEKGLTWAITSKENSTCIGTCGYGEIEMGNRGELGFDLAKEYWDKGNMSECLKRAIEDSSLYIC